MPSEHGLSIYVAAIGGSYLQWKLVVCAITTCRQRNKLVALITTLRITITPTILATMTLSVERSASASGVPRKAGTRVDLDYY